MSFTICCKWPIISNLRPSEWLCYKGNCKFLLRWFRDSFRGLLTIYIPILYLPNFSESNAWDFHLVMTEISGNVPASSKDFRRISEDFRSLPKIKCPLTVPEDVWALSKLLKTTLLACFGMISFEQKKGHYVLRTICPDLWTRREKLSLMRGIDVFSPKA